MCASLQKTTGGKLTTLYDMYVKDVVSMKDKLVGSRKIAEKLGISKSSVNYIYNKYLDTSGNGLSHNTDGPNILTLDIETAPILADVWRTFKQNVGLNQIQKDWHLLSFCAKWYDEESVIYQDQRDAKDFEDDTKLLETLWGLLNKADIVITQNGKKFDIPKIRARMVIKGFKPFSPVRHIDTFKIAKDTFGFTSNKLEYMVDKICKKYKKSSHKKFPGHEMWVECRNGNLDAWKEMEEYNILDVLSTEELYEYISPWSDKLPNFNLFTEGNDFRCNCGCTELRQDGYAVTDVSKFARYVCTGCGKWYRGRTNLLSKDKRGKLLTNVREN